MVNISQGCYVCVYYKIIDLLESVKAIHAKDKANPKLVSLRPSILRSLFTVGLFCKHFNIDMIVQTSSKVGMCIYVLNGT